MKLPSGPKRAGKAEKALVSAIFRRGKDLIRRD